MAKKKAKQYQPPRNARIDIVLDDEEKEKIMKMAIKEGLPVSTYCRWKLLKSAP